MTRSDGAGDETLADQEVESLGSEHEPGRGEPEAVMAGTAEEPGSVDVEEGPSLTPADLGLASGERAHPELPRGPQMRERLLARAAASASVGPAASGLAEFEEAGEDEVILPRDRELSLIGTSPQPAVPAPARRRRQTGLSANAVALFGTLLGTAAIATTIALLIRVAPEPRAIEWAPIVSPPLTSQSEKPAAQAVDPEASKAEPPAQKRKARARLPGPWRVRDAKQEANVRVVEGTIGREPFLRAIQVAGLPKKEAYRALIALKGLRDLEDCGRTDRFMAALDRSTSRLKAFEYIVSAEEVYQAREQEDGLLKGAKLDLKVTRERVEGTFVYTGGNIDESAERGGLESGLAAALAEALEGHMTLAELERGDRVRLVAQEVTVLGEFARYAGIEAVQIRPADPETKPLSVYYFRGSKSRGHYDQSGRAPYEGGWRKPVKGAPITSKFNMKRLHPVLKKVMPHTGTDFGAPTGAIVGASAPGTVSFIGYAGASGNLVKVEHPGGYETGYAHLSRFADQLRVGDKVKRLQVIGYVGSTGRSTGPHLHFTCKKDGKFIDPESLNLDGMRVLPSDERGEFDAARTKYDAMLEKIPWPDLPAGLRKAISAPAASEPLPMGGGDGPLEEETSMGLEEEEEPGELGMGSAEAEPAPAEQPSGNKIYLTEQELAALAPKR